MIIGTVMSPYTSFHPTLKLTLTPHPHPHPHLILTPTLTLTLVLATPQATVIFRLPGAMATSCMS